MLPGNSVTEQLATPILTDIWSQVLALQMVKQLISTLRIRTVLLPHGPRCVMETVSSVGTCLEGAGVNDLEAIVPAACDQQAYNSTGE